MTIVDPARLPEFAGDPAVVTFNHEPSMGEGQFLAPVVLNRYSLGQARARADGLCSHARRRCRHCDLVSLGWRGARLASEQDRLRRAIPGARRALRDELDNTPRRSPQILTSHKGKPYARDGLQSLLWQLTSRLEYLGLVQPGPCFHG